MEYQFNFPHPISVERIFNYFGRELNADATMYGGSAYDRKDKLGNTVFCILWDSPSEKNFFNIAYIVNPYAGHFITVSPTQRTNKLAIEVQKAVAPELWAILLIVSLKNRIEQIENSETKGIQLSEFSINTEDIARLGEGLLRIVE